MDEKQQGQGQAQGGQTGEKSYQGYAASGEDKIIESTSEAVHSPTKREEDRLTSPKPAIQSIGETPGDSNPALAESLNAQQGQAGSTAEMLMAREGAEESRLRASGADQANAIYQDQQDGVASQQYLDSDSGRPNWPDDRQREPLDYMQSPRANAPLGTGGASMLDQTLAGRVDAAVDRDSTQAAAQESRSGLSPVGHNEAEDTYERQEFGNPTPPSDMDLIAPEMSNLPPEDDDGK
jgi:hypothetical protein